ncbi:ExbD/TolR family protein [Hyphomonas johnsonii]|uniref:Biopolymertransporter ExbD/TolR n=1 Tax=Hyphomonas johnsonii MHS-2 TaxID=1280950 RepID=A0A059FSR4_9PROT|nr:biopolymer transporter ExbD [Hyphomonas johnsonii]KCZ93493.1 biopolymertransporter ExbD/TolR [Hyphomonas johnsonii MHS-2]
MKFAQPQLKPAGTKISLTPLIDVVFILLLFFMLTSTFADRRSMDMVTPALASVPDVTDALVTLDLTTEGIRFEGQSVAPDALVATLQPRLASGDPVVIQVAPGVGLEACVSVMDALEAAGARSISLRRQDSLQ